MNAAVLSAMAIWLGGCATMQTQSPKVSILVDLDPASTGRTVIVESITADRQGRLHLPDRVTGNILRVDPRSPKPTVVGRIEARQVGEKKVNADASGIDFNAQGDLFVAAGPFREVVRIRSGDLRTEKPGTAATFAMGVEGANGIAFDKQGNLYISGGRNGKVYRVGTGGGDAQVVAEIVAHARKLPDGKTEQAIVANGLAFDAQGILYVADTARGAVWQITIGSDGKAGKPTLLAQSPLLEGADGLAFDGSGKLWVTANERNALVTVTPGAGYRRSPRTTARGRWSFPALLSSSGTRVISTTSISPDGTIWTQTARTLWTVSGLRSRR